MHLCFKLVPERLSFAGGIAVECSLVSARAKDAAYVFADVVFCVDICCGSGDASDCTCDGDWGGLVRVALGLGSAEWWWELGTMSVGSLGHEPKAMMNDCESQAVVVWTVRDCRSNWVFLQRGNSNRSHSQAVLLGAAALNPSAAAPNVTDCRLALGLAVSLSIRASQSLFCRCGHYSALGYGVENQVPWSNPDALGNEWCFIGFAPESTEVGSVSARWTRILRK